MADKGTYKGTDLKYHLDIQAEGFSMENDDFCVDITDNSGKTVHLDKNDCYFDGDWYICFDTNSLQRGPLTAKVTAWVPDPCYESGYRTEVDKVELDYLH